MWDSGLNIKTKWSNPYNYDPIIQFVTDEQPNNSVYTYRLIGFNLEKYSDLCLKHFGNFGNSDHYWNNRSPEKIQSFMRDWTDNEKLKVVNVVEYCDIETGYPTWYNG